MNKEYCISSDGERFYGYYSSIDEAHDDAIDELNLKNGDAYYVGEINYCVANEFISADDIIDHIGERACDEVGDCADGWPNISTEDKHKLEKIITDFIEKRSPTSFFKVQNIEKYIYMGKGGE